MMDRCQTGLLSIQVVVSMALDDKFIFSEESMQYQPIPASICRTFKDYQEQLNMYVCAMYIQFGSFCDHALLMLHFPVCAA